MSSRSRRGKGQERSLDHPLQRSAKVEQRSDAFLAINPLGNIPGLIDSDGPDAQPITVAESLAVALYPMEKTGRLQPAAARDRASAFTWGSAVVAGFGASITDILYARQLGAEAHAPLIAKSFADLDVQRGPAPGQGRGA
jgi:glutathione S-transferase